MLLIVGLGNPGIRYDNTRHNAGFMLVDRICSEYGIILSRKGRGLSGVGRVGGVDVAVLKPLTFMNLSGEAVVDLLPEGGLDPGSVLAAYDDCDLPLGKVRVRKGGGSGGHRGVDSLIGALGSRDFPRIRLGIGRPPGNDVVEYVLSPFTDDERPELERMLIRAAEAVDTVIACGIEQAMNKFNS